HKNPELSEKSRSTEIESVNLVTDDKISEPHLETEFVEKLKLKDTSEEPVFGKFDLKGADLEKFAQKLNFDQLRYGPLTDKDIEKFYGTSKSDPVLLHLNSYNLCYHFAEFVGPDFTWPPTMRTAERRLIFDYIAHPENWFEEGEGEELAKNTIAYRRLIESGQLDPSRGSHILIINGKVVRYGPKISGEEYEELATKNPGMLYAPIIEKVVHAKFSSIQDDTNKEWQVHMRIRNKDKPDITATLANIERDNYLNCNFRLVLDTGCTYTVVPQLLRAKLPSRAGWSAITTYPVGYGTNSKMNQVSVPWEVSLGDGVNWTDWIETEELYSWQKVVSGDVSCGLVGFDVLDNTYQIKIPGQPYIFVTDDDSTNQLQRIYQQQQRI
ncbi:10478_t:CDS:2, partial [Ambispora leptoticha]